MRTCVIFNAGGFDSLIEPIGPDDYLLAADGGLIHMDRLGLTPHGILGDFDSLGYVPENAKVFPVEGAMMSASSEILGPSGSASGTV